MRSILATALLLTVFVSYGCQAQDPPRTGLRAVGAISLPGVRGRIDHLTVDRAGRRLFVAALGNGTVEVVDLQDRRVVHTIEGLQEPQGVVYLPGQRRVVVTNGEGASATIIDATTYAVVGNVALRADPDNVRLDDGTGRLLVGEGAGNDGALALLDSTSANVVKEISLPGHPESFQLDADGDRAYVNVPAVSQVVVVSRARASVVQTWPLDVAANFPMALDQAHQRLFVGTRRPARLLVLDTSTGQTVAALACTADADDIFYDEEARRIYVAGGEGAVTVVRQVDADTYRTEGKVPTAPGARTALFVAPWHRLYVAAPRGRHRDAEIRIYDTASAE